MKRVAQTLGVSRSSDDTALLDRLRQLVDERSTYGYRRIGALRNRERRSTGSAAVNDKRVCRLMAQNGLLLQRYTGQPDDRRGPPTRRVRRFLGSSFGGEKPMGEDDRNGINPVAVTTGWPSGQVFEGVIRHSLRYSPF